MLCLAPSASLRQSLGPQDVGYEGVTAGRGDFSLTIETNALRFGNFRRWCRLEWCFALFLTARCRQMPKGTGKVVAQNKKANHDYFIDETIEAGIVLQGTEIKSVRNGKVQLKDAFVRIRNNEAWISNMHISPYEQGNRFNHEPLRSRKLLLHKKQISELIGLSKQDGYSIIPIKMYMKDGFAKVLIGMGKGKKNYDKRDDLKKKEAKRDIERAFKSRNQD